MTVVVVNLSIVLCWSNIIILSVYYLLKWLYSFTHTHNVLFLSTLLDIYIYIYMNVKSLRPTLIFRIFSFFLVYIHIMANQPDNNIQTINQSINKFIYISLFINFIKLLLLSLYYWKHIFIVKLSEAIDFCVVWHNFSQIKIDRYVDLCVRCSCS